MLPYHCHGKTLAVAGLTWWNVYFQIFEKAIGALETVEFLLHLLRHLPGPLLIVWDRLPAHRSRLVWDFLRDLKGRITIESLPAYAPELHPVGTFRNKPTARRNVPWLPAHYSPLTSACAATHRTFAWMEKRRSFAALRMTAGR